MPQHRDTRGEANRVTNDPAICERLQAIEEKLDTLGTAAPRWLTISKASDYTSLSEETIRRLLSSGKITAHRVVKGRILIDRQELDNVIQTATKQPRRGRGINLTSNIHQA